MVYLLIVYLAILSIRDIQRKEFPVGVIWGGLGVGLIWVIIKGDWIATLLGIIPGVLLILMGFLTREKVGYGDGVLLIVVGLIMGWPGSLVVYMLAQFGVLFYAILLLIIKRAPKDVKIPFAPFLTVALVIYQMGGMIL